MQNLHTASRPHTWPSGSSYDFSRVEEDSEVAISCSKSSAT